MINITNEQKKELKVLNERLLKLQEKIIIEAIKIDLNLSNRVKNKEDVLDDYEIELELRFILKENDNEFKEEDDNFITVIREYLKGVSKKLDNYPFGKHFNHNDLDKSHPMSDFSHSWWFHCLYDHNNLSWEDMLRIEDFWSDIKVYYQYFD